jgi:hypothetical protein
MFGTTGNSRQTEWNRENYIKRRFLACTIQIGIVRAIKKLR